MIQKYLFVSLAILFFGVGVYTWKITNTGLHLPGDDPLGEEAQYTDLSHVLYVGKMPITQEDIEWEFDMHTKGLVEGEDLTPIPNIEVTDKMLDPLRERLMSDLIERKLLFQYIKQDNSFNLDEPARYTDCLEQWQQALRVNPDWFISDASRERLKSRLCEKSIIMQYLDERVFHDIVVTDTEIKDYYENHPEEFKEPKKVVIRQVVLASEREAKRVRARLTYHNFEEMAREVSITPEAENGGLLGPFAKGEMPPVFDVAFTMRRGEIRGILKSTYGFHLIRLDKKIPSVKLSLKEVEPRIKRLLKRQKQEEEYQQWVEMALNEVSIKSPRAL
jgi:hypothetical protein